MKPLEMYAVANAIVSDLSEFNLRIKTHALTGSCYVCSDIEDVHQIRVADHRGKGYAYKWEIRPDIQTETCVGRYKRNLYNLTDYSKFIAHFRNYYNKVLGSAQVQQQVNPFEDEDDAPLDITNYDDRNYSSTYR